jgi:hypothetical protein
MSNPSDQESGGWLESPGFGALDWASEKHSVVVVNPKGKLLEDFEIEHSAKPPMLSRYRARDQAFRKTSRVPSTMGLQ